MKRKEKDRQKTANVYRNLEKTVNESGKTLSHFFTQRLEEKRPVRRREHHVKTLSVDYAVPRFLVKDEFRKIWAKQSQHHKNLTPELEQEIYRLIFGDHPHAPYATSGCCTLIQAKAPAQNAQACRAKAYLRAACQCALCYGHG